MGLFLAVFAIFLVVVLAMSVGFIVQRKTISGSCGGIGALGMEKACDCDEPCDERKARMAKEEQWQQNRIK
ncbi:Na(+)-translocating NADH-quinone reductase subunit E [Pseudidiomarina aestuarii]|uniref:Na(+)-translocating NADH-quinone reductase subunit E n=1 Tax=Pseudidiomarina aestuarii TaxID=624146 RepID=A0A2T4CUU0_9GAMM|nr:Na(+)-translocating NADH-quinone reductase subunit E [Pseudidiomarina aestuarii]PTB89068.1 Na(+)-translocating NADH-quinone reductase subunit E [Pseudidiomarina aestuarii]